MELETIVNKLKCKYYNNIINYMEKNNIDTEWLNNHIITLNLNNIDNESAVNSSATDEVITESKTNYHDNIFSDELLYKKTWTKLNSIHKILKIKEFVNSLKFNVEDERSKLKDELINKIKSKILTKKNTVNYDEINGKIISIKDLEYKNGNYIYKN